MVTESLRKTDRRVSDKATSCCSSSTNDSRPAPHHFNSNRMFHGLRTCFFVYSAPVLVLLWCMALCCTVTPTSAFYLQDDTEQRQGAPSSNSLGDSNAEATRMIEYRRYVSNPIFESRLIWACSHHDATHYCTSGGKYCFMKRGIARPLCKCKNCHKGPRCEHQDIECILEELLMVTGGK